MHEEEVAATAETRARRPLAAKIMLVIAGLFTAWHVFASFLWISPPSELRSVVPGDALTSYMIPWYGQSWSVFAPAPINGDYRFQVRAVIADGTTDTGAPKYTSTSWVDATEVELSMSRHNLFPPRAANLSSQQASKLLNQWKKLSAEQKEIAALGFYEGDAWLGRLQAELGEVGSGAESIAPYILQERYSSAYATQIAFAVWGEDRVAQVQFQVSRQNIVPFSERLDPDAKRPEAEIAGTGWRGLIVMPGQSNSAFREVFLPTYERISQ